MIENLFPLVTYTIDWLSYTVGWEAVNDLAWDTLDEQREAVGNLTEVFSGWARALPLHGYETAWVNEAHGNLRVMASRPGDRMGIHVQFPGQALKQDDPMQQVRRAAELGASVTRIDLAIDIYGAAPVQDLYDAFMRKETSTRAQQCNLVTGTKGATTYVGSRSSERYLRAYDKAAQTDTPGDWTRVEIELKDRAAKAAVKDLMNGGYNIIPATIRRFLKAPTVAWYEDATTREQAALAPPQPKRFTDTRAWLLGTVAKTLAKETAKDADFLLEFLRIVQTMRRDEGGEVE